MFNGSEHELDIWGITLAVLRRWYVFLAIFGLALGGAYLAGRDSHPEYVGTASAMLTPPPTEAPVSNPFGNQEDANAALLIILNSSETVASIQDQGYTSTYEVIAAARTSVFNVEARGADEADVLATLSAVLATAEAELTERQASGGVPAGNRIGLQQLAPPSITNVETEGPVRVQAVIVIIGGAAAVVLSVLFDDIVGLFKRRRARLAAQRAESEESQSPPQEKAEAGGAASGPAPAGDDISPQVGEPDDEADGTLHEAGSDGDADGEDADGEDADGEDADGDGSLSAPPAVDAEDVEAASAAVAGSPDEHADAAPDDADVRDEADAGEVDVDIEDDPTIVVRYSPLKSDDDDRPLERDAALHGQGRP